MMCDQWGVVTLDHLSLFVSIFLNAGKHRHSWHGSRNTVYDETEGKIIATHLKM
jgi:hypothetical protein